MLAEYSTDIINRLYQTIEKKWTRVRRVSTQKYHIIVTVEAMEFMQTSRTSVVVNIVVSLHLLNLGAPPVSQEGEERKIGWIIQSNTSYENGRWLAKT